MKWRPSPGSTADFGATQVGRRKHGKRGIHLLRLPAGVHVTAGRQLTKPHEVEHLIRQYIADTGYGAGRAAIDDAVKHFRVDAHNQFDVSTPPGDVLGRVAQRFRAAEFLEADEILVVAPEIEEQFGSGSEAIVRTVVYDSRQIRGGFQDSYKMRALCRA